MPESSAGGHGRPFSPHPTRLPVDHRTAQRPRTHHSLTASEPWLLALQRLHANRWPDWRIAAALCALSAQQIAAIEANRCWNWRDVEDVMVHGSGQHWTTRQVRYWRRRLGLEACPRNHEVGTLPTLRRIAANRYQTDRQWVHLLTMGLELRRREVDIISLLRDRGPMTRRELCRARGVVDLGAGRAGARRPLARLQIAGLVRCSWEGRGEAIYRLTDRARPAVLRDPDVDLDGLADEVLAASS